LSLVIKTGKDPDAVIGEAAQVILKGGVVAVPTESFYGLAVDATNERAIKRLLEVKKRPPDNPILILVSSIRALEKHVRGISTIAQQLMERFWPGGLTIIFEAGPAISPLLTAGTGKIGVRLSSHPVPTELSKIAGVPITGTSANLSGRPGCVTGEEIIKTFGDGVDLTLDDGETQGGRGSTILDATVNPPKILREGMVTRDQLGELLYFSRNEK